mmetsp:Transcript_4079/g.7525  ORF Transcript_4079/g.7525 Transcript_4079/m.7525 type:complete len:286 (-) Transcript_4079:279-1136(-)|eukprot:CAMPEP_0197531652 /NCGR_PEP_ID=MMETSP1318-20131121/36511_1 /TAXON_ID=552666 /ORGANISM="Partenskyella glossopodia, Strain RCC365" /LENGTH=285 /DNA_ID=CAMNT_0043087941 /DNA_START=92 /DNA_END=949 /DNA_ORIENTATION=-
MEKARLTKEARRAKKGFDKITSDLKTSAIELIHVKLPEKVLEMHDLVQSLPLCDFNALKEVAGKIDGAGAVKDAKKSNNEDRPSKKRKLEASAANGSSSGSNAQLSAEAEPSSDSASSDSSDAPSSSRKRGPAVHKGLVPCNSGVVALVDCVKKQVMEMIQIVGVIKLYIQLNIPQIEDGNNFGVEIQEEAVAELNRVEDMAFSVLESLNKYYVMRGRFASKILKHPAVSDYVQSVKELDGKQYAWLKLTCVDIRNHYMVLHDIITKNEEKIKKPRTSDMKASMY